jgi:methylmalonyl-CoA mutase cobalamin-binding domain/chain
MGTRDDLIRAIKSGNADESVKMTRALLSDGSSAQEVLKTVTKTIREVGDAFEKFEIFLPQMMTSANAMIEIMKVLEPELKKEGPELAIRPAKIIMASVKGDMHEIGKNITITLFNANGYDILDMGADVDSLDIVKTAGREKADIIGLSSLMTTTMPGQKEVIDILKDTGQRDNFKVIIGGAPTSEEWADKIGADGWGKDASDAVRLVEKFID